MRLSFRLTVIACYAGALVSVGCASREETEALSALDQVAVTAVNTPSAHAQRDLPDLTGTPTLADYLTYAALNSPQLEAAFNEWKSALQEVAVARSLPDPRLTYGYYIEAVETRAGPQEQRVGLSQMVPWFGKLRLRGEAALKGADAAQQRYEATKLDLFYRVKEAYHEYHYLGRAIAITEDNVRLLENLESVARAKHRAGAPLSGVIKAQVELGKLEDRLRALRDLQGAVVAQLNGILGRATEAPLPWPRHVSLTDHLVLSDTEALIWLSAHNPDLNALQDRVEQSRKRADLARTEYYPDITLGVDYIQTGEALMAGTPDSGKDPLIAMITINLPIWRGKLRAGVEEAEARQDAAEQGRSHRENELAARLKMVLFRYRDAERKIDLYHGTLLPQAEQSLNVTKQAYEAGAVDFLDLIDAQRLLLQFQLEHERARTNQQQRLAELEMLIGRPLPTTTRKQPQP